MLLNQTRRAHERKRTQCMEPNPRPLAKPAFRPFLYVFIRAALYDLTALSSPANACTVLTLPITLNPQRLYHRHRTYNGFFTCIWRAILKQS